MKNVLFFPILVSVRKTFVMNTTVYANMLIMITKKNYERITVEPIAIEHNGFSYLRDECVSILLSYIEELKDQVREEREEKKKILALVRGDSPH